MKFLRVLVAVPAFLVFPVALIVLSDSVVFEAELPDVVAAIASEMVDSPTARAELIDEMGSAWLQENPELETRLIAGRLDPKATMTATFNQLAETPEFRVEFERSARAYGTALVAGETPQISLDFAAAIAASRQEFDPQVASVLQDFSAVSPQTLPGSEVLEFQRLLARVKMLSAAISLGALIILIASTRSLRFVPAALFVVGLPVLLTQRWILKEIANDPDEIDSLIGTVGAETWLPWTFLMMAIAVGAGVTFVASYKLFPKKASLAGGLSDERSDSPTGARQPASDQTGGDLADLWDQDDDYAGLRSLSIIDE